MNSGGIVAEHAMIVGLMAIIALLWPMGIISTPVWSGGFLGFWFSFLTGVLVCWGALRGGRYRLLAIIFCIALLIAGWQNAAQLTVTVAITGLLMSSVGALGRMNTWLNWRWIQWLALISYSLYLLHNPITGLTYRVVHLLVPPGVMADMVGFVASLAMCLLGSYIAYLLIERPCIRWSHLIFLSKKAT
jgi:peptidoglycan/LPS O-acetylase OafA/YrhL